MDEYYQITPIGKHLFRIASQEGSISDLIVGENRAALIDTGYGIGDLPGTIRSLTSLPLLVFNTHCHCDHIGGNSLFQGPIRMGSEDIPTCPYTNSRFFRQTMVDGVKNKPAGFDAEAYLARGFGQLIPCDEGESFDLGGLTIRVYNVPGHSVGSRAYYVEQLRVLYTGDSIGSSILLFGYGAADRKTYIAALDKLLAIPFETIYGAHTAKAMGREDMVLCRRVAQEAVYETGTPFPNPIRNGEDARICCLPGMSLKDEGEPGFASIIVSANS